MATGFTNPPRATPRNWTRAERRNAARKNHDIHVWKDGRWHERDHRTGMVIVRYPHVAKGYR